MSTSPPGGWARVQRSRALWRSGFVEWLGRSAVFERRRTQAGLWWGKRSPRERRLLLVLGGTATLGLLATGIYQPLAETRAKALADIRTYEVLIAQLRTAGPELARLRSLDKGAAPAYVSSSASGYGLAVAGLRSDAGMVTVTFRNADFVKLAQWLGQVESESRVRLVAITVERQQLPGVVDARLVLRS